MKNIEDLQFFPLRDKVEDINWFDQDSKALYKKNLKSQPTDWIYRNKVVKYFTNSNGYRTKEFKDINWAKSIVIFGCSHVFGVGVSEDETISYHLSDMAKVNVVNMGVPGSSPMFSLHNSLMMLESLPNPIGVVFGWSSYLRCPLYLNDKVVHCGSWNEDIASLGKSWRLFDSHAESFLKLTRINAIQLWNKIRYSDFTLFPSNKNIIPECKFIKKVDSARDCVHSGTVTNEMIAKYIAESMSL